MHVYCIYTYTIYIIFCSEAKPKAKKQNQKAKLKANIKRKVTTQKQKAKPKAIRKQKATTKSKK